MDQSAAVPEFTEIVPDDLPAGAEATAATCDSPLFPACFPASSCFAAVAFSRDSYTDFHYLSLVGIADLSAAFAWALPFFSATCLCG